MAPPNPCDKFVDAWSSREPPSPEALEHLATCESCSALARTFRHVQTQCHGNPPEALAALREKVLRTSFPPAVHPPAPRWPALPLGLATAVLLLLTAGLLATLWVSHRPTTPGYVMTIPGEPSWEASFEQPVSLGTGSAIAEIPRVAVLEFEGPAYALLASSHAQVFWGKATVRGAAPPVPFQLITPHGRVDSRGGGRFSCIVKAQDTSVLALDGSLRLLTADLPPRELAPGQQDVLVNQIQAGSVASAAPPMVPESATQSMYQVDDDEAPTGN